MGGSWISPLSSIAATAHSRLACASTSTWSCAWLGAWPRRPTSRTSRRRRCSRPGATATRSTRAGRRCGPGCWRSSYGSPARPGPGPCGRHRAPCRLNPGACPSGPGSAETLPSGGSPRVAACGAGPTRDVRGRTTPGASHSPWSRFAVSPSSVEGTPASRAAAQGDHGRCALPAGHAHAGVDGDDASEEAQVHSANRSLEHPDTRRARARLVRPTCTRRLPRPGIRPSPWRCPADSPSFGVRSPGLRPTPVKTSRDPVPAHHQTRGARL